MNIDVKENLNLKEIEKPSFIERQGVDANAAYERLAITRRTLKEYRAAINATNTVDVAGEHLKLYAEVEKLMVLIALEEQMLINQGK